VNAHLKLVHLIESTCAHLTSCSLNCKLPVHSQVTEEKIRVVTYMCVYCFNLYCYYEMRYLLLRKYNRCYCCCSYMAFHVPGFITVLSRCNCHHSKFHLVNLMVYRARR